MKALLRLALAFVSAYATGLTRDSDGTYEDASIRSFFYIGGSYVPDGSGGHIHRDQMYVERLRPVHRAIHDVPIVLIHGQAQTGSVSHPRRLSRLRGSGPTYVLTCDPCRTS